MLGLETMIELSLEGTSFPTVTQPLAPNFFVEAKGPSDSAKVALNQACFDGAVGARGIYELEMYGIEASTCDNNPYTVSAPYNAGTLKMYSHHLSPPNGPSTQPEYYMNQLNTWGLTGNKETLVEGIAAFRNAVSWTETQRNTAISSALTARHAQNNRDDEDEEKSEAEGDGEDELANADPVLNSFTIQSPICTSQSTSRKGEAIQCDSDTSPDELALDDQTLDHIRGKRIPHKRAYRRKRQNSKR